MWKHTTDRLDRAGSEKNGMDHLKLGRKIASRITIDQCGKSGISKSQTCSTSELFCLTHNVGTCRDEQLSREGNSSRVFFFFF